MSPLTAAPSFTQLAGSDPVNLTAFVNALLGPDPGISVSNISFTGSVVQAGYAYDPSYGTAGDGTPMSLGADGIILSSGDGTPPTSNTSSSYTMSIGGPGDADLSAVLAGAGLYSVTNDAVVLEFDFTVTREGMNAIALDFMFGSDEYPEYAGSSFVDGAAVFVDGVNCAVFDDGSPLSVNEVGFFENNGGFSIEYDGLSKPARVVGLMDMDLTTHHVKIVVADTGDTALDTALIMALMESVYSEDGGIVPPNQAPTDISISNSSVDENQPSGTAVGDFSSTDPDPGDTHTYSLVSGTGDTDNGSFTIDGNTLKTAETFDYETRSSYSIRVRTDDGNGGTYEEVFTITVNDVNEPPTDISLSSEDVDEEEPSGTAVGTLSTTDQDTGDSHTYSLVSGTGDTDNGSFTIDGNTLKTAEVFDYESKSSYSIRVRTDDGNGGTYEEVFTITVNDISEPPIALPATDVGQVSFTANWEAPTPVPDSYRLDVSLASDFSSFVPGYQDRVVSATMEQVTGLTLNTMYYYRIRAVATAGTSVDSNVISQRTKKYWEMYLPQVFKLYLRAPDLVVDQVTATRDDAEVVIRNAGNGPATDWFWVDLYVNPHPIPTGANQMWYDGRCSHGIVWGVGGDALPLEPGETITLTYGGDRYWPSMSNYGGVRAGTLIYVQVDSVNSATDYGAVLETHEIEGGVYNNILGPAYSTQ